MGHFVPAYDKWFDNKFINQWGEKNDTEVIVDHVGIPTINSRAAAEVSAQRGHDLFMFLWPPPTYETQVIDHKEIYQECERKRGKPIELGVKSTYNPKTKKYFGFSDSFVPDPVNYRIDLWRDAGMANGPANWDNVLQIGKKIKDTTRISVGGVHAGVAGARCGAGKILVMALYRNFRGRGFVPLLVLLPWVALISLATVIILAAPIPD